MASHRIPVLCSCSAAVRGINEGNEFTDCTTLFSSLSLSLSFYFFLEHEVWVDVVMPLSPVAVTHIIWATIGREAKATRLRGDVAKAPSTAPQRRPRRRGAATDVTPKAPHTTTRPSHPPVPPGTSHSHLLPRQSTCPADPSPPGAWHRPSAFALPHPGWERPLAWGFTVKSGARGVQRGPEGGRRG